MTPASIGGRAGGLAAAFLAAVTGLAVVRGWTARCVVFETVRRSAAGGDVALVLRNRGDAEARVVAATPLSSDVSPATFLAPVAIPAGDGVVVGVVPASPQGGRPSRMMLDVVGADGRLASLVLTW